MKQLDLDLAVNISSVYLDAFKAALKDDDLVALKAVLLASCTPDEVASIEALLPAELVQPI